MDLIDRLLLPGERTRVVVRPHWIALVRAVAIRAFQVALIWLMLKAAHSAMLDRFLELPFVRDLGPAGGPIPLAAYAGKLGLVLFLLVLLLAGFDALRWWLARYALTDQRVLNLSGVIVREVVDSPLDRIDDLLLVQSWLGEKLDYGDLVVLRGQESGNYLAAMEEPLRFQQAMHAARLGRVPRKAVNGHETGAARRPARGRRADALDAGGHEDIVSEPSVPPAASD